MSKKSQIFREIWEMDWLSGATYVQGAQIGQFYVSDSPIPGTLTNYASSHELDIADGSLEKLEAYFLEKKYTKSIFLFENQLQTGWPEKIVKYGYKFDSWDCWLYANNFGKKVVKTLPVLVKDSKRCEDRFKIMLNMFPGYELGQETYLKMEQDIFMGLRKIADIDTKIEMFLIYEDNRPVAGASLFYNKVKNIGYFHNDGTTETYRGKGYQTDLINHRLNRLAELGITRAYVCTDYGNQSWRNYINCGFEILQTGAFFVKN